MAIVVALIAIHMVCFILMFRTILVSRQRGGGPEPMPRNDSTGVSHVVLLQACWPAVYSGASLVQARQSSKDNTLLDSHLRTAAQRWSLALVCGLGSPCCSPRHATTPGGLLR
jgi:hypothetical protein